MSKYVCMCLFECVGACYKLYVDVCVFMSFVGCVFGGLVFNYLVVMWCIVC